MQRLSLVLTTVLGAIAHASNIDLSELTLLAGDVDINTNLTAEALRRIGWERRVIVNFNNGMDQVETFIKDTHCAIVFNPVNDAVDTNQMFGGISLPPAEVCGFQVSAGVAQEIMGLVSSPHYQSVVDFMNQASCATVTATGFSLGGALATMWAACANRGATIGAASTGSRTDYALVTFGAPAIGMTQFYNGQPGVPFVGTRYAVTEPDGGASYMSGFRVDTKTFRLETLQLLIDVTAAKGMTAESALVAATKQQLEPLSAEEIEAAWSATAFLLPMALLLFAEATVSSAAAGLIHAQIAKWAPTGVLSMLYDPISSLFQAAGFQHALQDFQPSVNKLAPSAYRAPMAKVPAESAVHLSHGDLYQSLFSILALSGAFANHGTCCYSDLENEECSRQFLHPEWRVCASGLLGYMPAEPTPTYTCGDIKGMYKQNRCCGNPDAPFTMPQARLLAATTAIDADELLAEVRVALRRASAKGGASAATLARRIDGVLQRL